MIESISEYTGFSSGAAVIAMLAGIVVFVLLLWLVIPFKRYLAVWKIRNHIGKLGAKTLSNLRIPDGVDGELFIDHLVLNGNKVIVVNVKQYDGLIYGNETLDSWTQVVNQRNFQFSNPLYQMKHQVMAVKSLLPELEVDGTVLFAGRSHFPKRVPEGVLTLEDIPRRASKEAVSGEVLSCWQQLQQYQHNS